MLAKSVRLLLLSMAAGLAGGCSTPCGAPGRLCAPISSLTSPPAAPASPATPAAPPQPLPPPAQTYAVAMPGAAGGDADAAAAMPQQARLDAVPSYQPLRVALLLPLHSAALGQAAASVRAGFLAAWEHDRDGVAINVVDTGETPQEVLSSFAIEQDKADLLVGPLGRSAVGALAASSLVRKPTIALNTPEGRPGQTALPPQMLAIGLSIEEEARQAARWAATERPGASALVLTTGTQWQRRAAGAFAAEWQRRGMAARTLELGATDGYLSDPELVQLRGRLQTEPPGLLFVALGADQTRQLRAMLSGALPDELPIYATSSLNPGNGNSLPTQDLDGVRLLDLPWQLQSDHPAVMIYPHPPQPAEERKPGAADMERLYALGIDAYRVAREIGHHAEARFQLDGVTGQLTVSFGRGPAAFERAEQPAVYKNGVAQPVAP